MLSINDIRDYIDSLGIADVCYCGKLPSGVSKAIGVYPLNRGLENIPRDKSYDIRPISMLVHWNMSPAETEKAAYELFNEINNKSNIDINQHEVVLIRPVYDMPIPIGTDDKGVYEWVIECFFYVNK